MYGTTMHGGSQYGVLFCFDPIKDTEVVLETFNGTNGAYPQSSLVQDPDNGLLYGTTTYGGSANKGVLFSYDTATSVYTKLIDFIGSNGSYPVAGVTLVDTLISTGLNKINEDIGAKVYPNPNNGQFTLSLSNITEKCNIEIYNVLGEKVFSHYQITKSSNYQINLSSQPNGIYLYRVVKEDGGLVGEGKMVLLR